MIVFGRFAEPLMRRAIAKLSPSEVNDAVKQIWPESDSRDLPRGQPPGQVSGCS